MHLVTIAFSHYNEKARWVLDRFGVPYTESRYLPMLHMLGVLWATRGRGGRADGISTRLSTPVLITDDGTRLCDSTEIVRYVSDVYGDAKTSLYPDPWRNEIEEIERRLHDRLGPDTRRVVYHHALGDRAVMRALAYDNVGRVQAWLFLRALPVERWIMRRALRIDAARAQRSEQRIHEEIAWLDERLGDRPYLVGDRFTAADLTAACMLAPVLGVSSAEGYGARFPPREAVDPVLRAFVEQQRDTRVGRWALRMFATERGRPAAA